MRNWFFLICLYFIHFTSTAQYWVRQGIGSQNNMSYDICTDASGNNFTTGYFSAGMDLGGTIINSTGITDMFLVKSDANGVVQWVVRAGGNNITQGLAVCTDHAGNVIVVGFFYGIAAFGSQTLTATGSKDGFIAKYDNAGNFLWALKVEGSLLESVNKVAIDFNDNILVTGEFSSSNFLIGTSTLSSPNNSLDVFVCKLSPAGNVQWLKSGTAAFVDKGMQITSDSHGDVYVGGVFSDSITFDNTHYNTMYNAVFVIKYSSSGQEQWFRYMGSSSTVSMEGLKCDQSDNVVVLGNYTGSLIYFNFSSATTLTNAYSNNYYLTSISTNGEINWNTTDGSSAPVSSECLSISSGGELAIGGTYECRFNDFADQYGQGIFCSLGYRDCFIALYTGAGNWISSRCYGGNKNDYLYGIVYDNSGIPLVAGGFEKNIYFPSAHNTVLGYGQEDIDYFHSNCNEPFYYNNYHFNNNGNSDVYFGRAINFTRIPMDIFLRDGAGCDVTFRPLCVNECEDTIHACARTTLHANMYQHQYYTPDYEFLWNTGDTAQAIQVTTSGIYYVIMNTPDGCFTDADSVFVDIHANPPPPLISDSKGVNTLALTTTPISYCYPDSVLLTSTVPLGTTVQWLGGNANDPQYLVNTAGFFPLQVTATDSFGCTSFNFVNVYAFPQLDTIDPHIICLNDTDQNDSIVICSGNPFYVFCYDTISNPQWSTLYCIPEETITRWTIDNPTAYIDSVTHCFQNQIRVSTSGWYTYFAHLERNNCDTDYYDLSDSIYVEVVPVGSGTLPLSISGDSTFCPGDSVLLIASGSTASYHWSNSFVGDSIYVSISGVYTVTSTVDSINSNGCHIPYIGGAFYTVYMETLPVITASPSVLCPNDSVQLTCTSSPGVSYSWQGPSGILPVDTNVVWVNTPGMYSCTQIGNCHLFSNTLNITQYTTPILTTNGASAICNHSPVQLQLICDPSSTVQWQSPLGGNGTHPTVYNPGVYQVLVTQCNLTIPLSITVPESNPISVIATSDSLDFCNGDSIRIFSATPAQSYLWLPGGQVTDSIYVTQAGQYILQITDSINCTANDTVICNVTVNNLTAPLASDTTLCTGESVVLSAEGSAQLIWLNSSLQYQHTGTSFQVPAMEQSTYFLVYSDSGNCKSAIDTVRVIIENCDSIPVPNIITINNDGKNDLFPNFAEAGLLYSIQIFNRWGKRLYHSIDSDKQWTGFDDDGNRLSDGTYYYLLSVKHVSGRKQDAHGWVMVLNGK